MLLDHSTYPSSRVYFASSNSYHKDFMIGGLLIELLRVVAQSVLASVRVYCHPRAMPLTLRRLPRCCKGQGRGEIRCIRASAFFLLHGSHTMLY